MLNDAGGLRAYILKDIRKLNGAGLEVLVVANDVAILGVVLVNFENVLLVERDALVLESRNRA